MKRARRTRIEVYADVLRVLKISESGCGITRLSYGSNMPLDRMKKTADELISYGLMTKRASDPRTYIITTRGIEFLEAFKKLALFLE